MATIIVGFFDTDSQLDAATNGLMNEGLASTDMAYYYLNPPGARGLYKLDGDAINDEGTAENGKTATQSAAAGGVAGLAIGSIGGPFSAVVGAGAGAYIGAFMRTHKNREAPNSDNATVEQPAEPPPGPLLAMRVIQPDQNADLVRVLRDFGAIRVDQTIGEWENGNWTDFDARKQVQTLYRKDKTVL